MISISHYLYRKTRHKAIAALVVLSLSAIGSAQIRDRTEHQPVGQEQTQATAKKPAKRGPRAIGVIEFLPKGGARLVPIALWIDGRYYDASFYGANPEPMALQPETLYEGLSYGEPTGWFTVTTPKQVNGNWVADGKWKPQSAFDMKAAEQAAKQAKKKAPSGISDDSGPPVLRRAPSSGSSETEPSSGGASSSSSSPGTSTASSGSAPAPRSSNDSGRPTLKDSSPSSSTSSSRPTLGSDAPQANAQTPTTTPPPSDDSDRPTLKSSSPSSSTSSSRPTPDSDTSQANAQTPATTPPPPTSSPNENDPDRPLLKRGKPAAQPITAATATAAAPKTNASKTPPAEAAAQLPKASTAASSSPPAQAYPAISDAGVYETRSLLYAMTPAEKDERGRPMLALALDEVRSYTSKRQQAKAAPKAPAKAAPKAPAKTAAKAAAQPEDFVVTDYDLRAFDLDFSNSPTLVLTGKVTSASTKPTAGGEFNYFVTVVARVDINGQAQKVFSSVTDNNHLDAFPRLEIIDAVDADANGRGDLLFRQHSDSGINYALYRVYPYQMVKVFEGGAGM